MAGKLLIVDDEPDIRTMLATIFRSEGWEITEAEDGPSARAALQDDPPDLVILDNFMPGMSGIELAEEMREEGSSIPIVLFSGYLNDEFLKQAEKLGLWPCSKLDMDVLVRVVRNLMWEALAKQT